eukprot:765092-Hanusia_phi.AAC.8
MAEHHNVNRPRSVPQHLSSNSAIHVRQVACAEKPHRIEFPSPARSATPGPNMASTRRIRSRKLRSSSQSSNFYIPEGSDAPVKSGDEIRRMIDPGYKVKHQKEVLERTSVHLGQTLEKTVESYKTEYFELDITSRPLEMIPLKCAKIIFHVIMGSCEVFISMIDHAEYPSREHFDWMLPPIDLYDGLGRADESVTLVISPVDKAYASSKARKIILGIRSPSGHVHFKLNAQLKSFLSGKASQMLEDRSTRKKMERDIKVKETKEIKQSVLDSEVRTKLARSGKEMQIPEFRPMIMDHQASSRVKSPLASLARNVQATVVQSKPSSESLLSILDRLEQDHKGEAEALVDQQINNSFQRLNSSSMYQGSATQRSNALATGREGWTSRTARSSTRKKRLVSKQAQVPIDPDVVELDKGNWEKVVLSAKIPAAMRLQWAVEEIESAKNNYQGLTGARRYLRNHPLETRKQAASKSISSRMIPMSARSINFGNLVTEQVRTARSHYSGEIHTERSQQEHAHHPPVAETSEAGDAANGLLQFSQRPWDYPEIPPLDFKLLLERMSGKASQPFASETPDVPQLSERRGDASARNEPQKGGLSSRGEGPSSARGKLDGSSSARLNKEGASSARGRAEAALSSRESLSARSSSSIESESGLQKALLADDEKLCLSLFSKYRANHMTRFSKTQEFLEKLGPEDPAAEVGMSLTNLIKLLLEMKIITTGKSGVFNRRDIVTMGRECFHQRGQLYHPTEDEIILSYDEFKSILDKISKALGKPYYVDRARPAGIDKKLWDRIMEDTKPEIRLKRIAQDQNFRKKILRAFGVHDRDSDGLLLWEEFHELCRKELGVKKAHSLKMLETAHVNLEGRGLTVEAFMSLFLSPDPDPVDARETEESYKNAIVTEYRRLHAEFCAGSEDTQATASKYRAIEHLQGKAKKFSTSKEEVKAGWLYRRVYSSCRCSDHRPIGVETFGPIKKWMMYYAVLEKRIGGSVLRLFNSTLPDEDLESDLAYEEAGQIDALWIDGADPVEIVYLVDSSEVRQEAAKHAAAQLERMQERLLSLRSSKKRDLASSRISLTSETERSQGSENSEDLSCSIIKVRCSSSKLVSGKHEVLLKIRSECAEDEAEDWVEAIRSSVPELQLAMGEDLRRIEGVARSTPELRDVCVPLDHEEEILASTVANVIAEALKPSCIIMPVLDSQGNLTLAAGGDEDKSEQDKKKKLAGMLEVIVEETEEDLLAFLTPIAELLE